METEGSVETIDGHEVKYTERTVENSCGTFILCHGMTMDRDEWQDLYSEIAEFLAGEGYSSLRFDFRGHGESRMEDVDLTVGGAVMDLEAIIKSAGEEVHLLASSFGAVPSILCSREHDIESLVMLCPLIDTRKNYFEPEGDSFVEKNREELEKKAYITRPDGFRMSAELLYVHRSLRPQRILGELEIPVLTVQGGDDSGVSPGVSREFGEPNQDSKYIEFDDADHGLIDPEDDGFGEGTRQNWERFKSHLADWLD